MARDHVRPSIARNGFQVALPCYVKGRQIQAGGNFYTRGQVFPWQELGMKPERVANMFPRLLRHDPADLQRLGLDPTKPQADLSGEPYVVPEPSVAELEAKDPHEMTMRELKDLAKARGIPQKRTRDDQLAAILEAQEATE